MLPDALHSVSLRDLDAISMLARTLHFGRAAEACGLAQSSLSALVRRFEDAVGQPVFDRSSRRVAVAPEGVFVLEAVERTLRAARGLEADAAGGEELTGWYRLGAIPTLGPYLLPHLLPTLIETFPEARFLLREALTEQLVGTLQSERLDAALMTLPVAGSGLTQYPLFDEELVLATPAGHPLADRRRIHRNEVPTGELILMDHGHCLRDNTLKVCGGMGSGVPAHATGVETLLAMVAAGVGCAVIPALAARQPRGMSERIRIRRFVEPVPTRTIGLVFRAATGRSDRARRLLETVRGIEVDTSGAGPLSAASSTAPV